MQTTTGDREPSVRYPPAALCTGSIAALIGADTERLLVRHHAPVAEAVAAVVAGSAVGLATFALLRRYGAQLDHWRFGRTWAASRFRWWVDLSVAALLGILVVSGWLSA